MRKIQCFITLICIGLFAVKVFPQTDLQAKFDKLIPGETNLEQIEKIFGDTTSKDRVTDWWGRYLRNGKFEASVNSNDYDVNRDSTAGLIKRTIYELKYDNLGLKLTVFDNPWLLYSVECSNPKITVKNIKVGDSLSTVETAFGKAVWETTEGSDIWWNSYEKEGLSFGFLRDKKVRQFPLKLVENPTVVSITVSDSKVSFVRY